MGSTDQGRETDPNTEDGVLLPGESKRKYEKRFSRILGPSNSEGKTWSDPTASSENDK